MPRPKKTFANLDQRPSYSYVTLAAMAIWSAPNRMLKINDIYNYIQYNFPYYRSNCAKWKNSLRNMLSVNDCFVRVSYSKSPGISNGKGCYWTLHPDSIDMFKNGGYARRGKRFKSLSGNDFINSNMWYWNCAQEQHLQEELLRQHLLTQAAAWSHQVSPSHIHLGQNLRHQSNSYTFPVPLSPIESPSSSRTSTSDLEKKFRKTKDYTIDNLLAPEMPSQSTKSSNSSSSSVTSS